MACRARANKVKRKCPGRVRHRVMTAADCGLRGCALASQERIGVDVSAREGTSHIQKTPAHHKSSRKPLHCFDCDVTPLVHKKLATRAFCREERSH
eukprot:6211198-Pleurochrysis_carterae.AAC.4